MSGKNLNALTWFIVTTNSISQIGKLRLREVK